MTKDTARRVSELMIELGAKLDASVALVQQTESEEEFHQYRRTVGKLMGWMLLDVMNPIYAEYPDLTPPELRREH